MIPAFRYNLLCVDDGAAEDIAEYKGEKIDAFDYGNCISVHKSQGSEWEKVVLFEQRTKRWDDKFYTKWLYTAVTRAKKKLLVISDAYI